MDSALVDVDVDIDIPVAMLGSSVTLPTSNLVHGSFRKSNTLLTENRVYEHSSVDVGFESAVVLKSSAPRDGKGIYSGRVKGKLARVMEQDRSYLENPVNFKYPGISVPSVSSAADVTTVSLDQLDSAETVTTYRKMKKKSCDFCVSKSEVSDSVESVAITKVESQPKTLKKKKLK